MLGGDSVRACSCPIVASLEHSEKYNSMMSDSQIGSNCCQVSRAFYQDQFYAGVLRISKTNSSEQVAGESPEVIALIGGNDYKPRHRE